MPRIVPVLIALALFFGLMTSFPPTAQANENTFDTDKYDIARIVFAEAAGEPIEGKYAVASVVLNRVNAKGYPNSIQRVINQKNAFSPVLYDSRLYRLTISPDEMTEAEAKAWENSLICAHYALVAGTIPDIVAFRSNNGGASYFNKLEMVLHVGNHRFYKHRF